VTNPWGRQQDDLSPVRAVLLSLSVEPQDVSLIADKAGLRDDEVLVALQQLADDDLVIREDDTYELTGPLCWFGTFERALEHHARKHLLVTVVGELESHLYVCDVRVKSGPPSGDPGTRTVTVLGCGRTAHHVVQAPAESGSRPACRDCAAAARPRAAAAG
jgi:hypothetical protein